LKVWGLNNFYIAIAEAKPDCTGGKMLTHFERPEESKMLYFKLSSSFQIIEEKSSATYKFAGIYAIYKDDICYYIGQSKNLASRLSQHINGKYSGVDRVVIFTPWINDVNFYDQKKEVQKIILEQNEMTLMRMLKPIENLITPSDEFEPREDFTFESLKHGLYDGFFQEMASMTVYVEKYNISVVSGDSDSYCNFDGGVFRNHNEFVVSAYKHFGDDAFNRGII
jgi:predicted GIY-YIG superfamily endonuclease